MLYHRFFLIGSIVLLLVFLGSATVGAESESIFIDPSDASLIRKTLVPFESTILLSSRDLPKESEIHPGVRFGELKFSSIAPSPDGTSLAFVAADAQYAWAGIFSPANRKILQLNLLSGGEMLVPHWSEDENYLVVEVEEALGKKILQIFDLANVATCRIDGQRARDKYLSFSHPWWSLGGAKIFFRVEYNNVYRKSVGLRAKPIASRIGEADPHCQKIAYYSVANFMEKFPEDIPASESMALSPSGKDLP